MLAFLDPLRELNTVSALLRMGLAMLCGGLIGLERGKKHRPAGFRTYMLVCLGAALTMLLSQYMAAMEQGPWAAAADGLNKYVDVSRFGARVISGIGFLGAGTILLTSRLSIKGLTTAAGLWAAACMGLAVGAGFYEAVVLAFVLMFLSMRILPAIENTIIERARNLNIYVEFRSLENVGDIINCLRLLGVHIYEVDIDRGRSERGADPNAVFSLRLARGLHHTQVLTAVSELDGVRVIDEI